MRHIAILMFLIVFTHYQCGAQKYLNLKTYNVDSLFSILPDQIELERIKSLNNLAVSLSIIDFDSSMQYADEAMKLAVELDYKYGKANAFRNYGHIYQYQGNYPVALNNYLKALTLFDKTDKYKAADVCRDIATTHYFATNHKKAIEYSKIAMERFHERFNDSAYPGSARDTMSIKTGRALLYFLMDRCEESLDLTLEYLKIGQANDFNKTDMLLHLVLAGERYYCSGNTDSAIFYINKAIAFPNLNPSIEALKYRGINFLGYIHFNKGAYDSAFFYYQKAYEFYQSKGFLFWATSTSNSLGYSYYQINKQDLAEKHFLQSEKLFDEMRSKQSWFRNDSLRYVVTWGIELYYPLPPEKIKSIMWRQGKFMYAQLYQINKKAGKTDKALKYHIAYSNAVDTLNKIRRNRDIIEMQTKYETERNEEQIVALSLENAYQELRLKQTRYFMFGLSGLVILVIILAIVLIRQNKMRNRQKTLVLQQKLFRSQMNPHFIFNSLTSIQNYIMDEEAHKASKYLSRFSKLVRHILDSSVEEFVTLEDEISTIENYLELQKLRFKDKFNYSIEIDKSINPDSISIPPMLAQPFIENSIEHGIKHKDSPGNIFIRFRMKNKNIFFEVEDDGIGRKKAMEILLRQNKDHKSLATSITYERIKVLNRKHRKKINLQIEDLINDLEAPSGTLVAFTIPVS